MITPYHPRRDASYTEASRNLLGRDLNTGLWSTFLGVQICGFGTEIQSTQKGLVSILLLDKNRVITILTIRVFNILEHFSFMFEIQSNSRTK